MMFTEASLVLKCFNEITKTMKVENTESAYPYDKRAKDGGGGGGGGGQKMWIASPICRNIYHGVV